MTKFLAGRTARVTATALGTAAIMAAGASAASATTVLAGGSALASGSTVSGPLSGSATLVTTSGTATCTGGNLSGTIGTNPASPSVALTPTGFNLGNAVSGGSCTDNIASVNVTGASLATAGTGSITTNAGLTGGTLNIINPTIKVTFTAGGLPGNCTFVINNSTSTATASLLNSDNSVTFSNVPVKTTATSGTCTVFNGSSFSATFKPLTSGGTAVTLG